MRRDVRSRRTRWLLGAFIILVTLAVFSPSLGNGFVNWDDQQLISYSGWRGVHLKNIYWWFTSLVAGDYKPLVWASYELDYVFWGLNPAGYHLSNVLLHALNGFVFFWVLLRVKGDGGEWPAFIAALFWVLHPLRVESVSWVTERKDVLFSFFYLLSIFFYIRYAGCRKLVSRNKGSCGETARSDYLLSLLGAVFASLSKPMAASLPAVLILIDVFPMRRLKARAGKVLLEKVPYCLFALATAGVAVLSRLKSHSFLSLSNAGIGRRLLLAGKSWLFYIVKTLFPFQLQPVYEKSLDFFWGSLPAVIPLMILVGVTAYLFYLSRPGRYWPLFAGLLYLITWFPVSGLLPSGTVWVADRFSYLPSLGFSIALFYVMVRVGGRVRNGIGLLAGGVLGVLSILTIRQEYIWDNSITLWEKTLSINPRCSIACSNLGQALVEQGRLNEAIVYFLEALRIGPYYAQAHNNLGKVFTEQGKLEEAADHYLKALQLQPDFALVHYNLGVVRTWQGKIEEAIVHYSEAIKFRPDDIAARSNLEFLQAQQKRINEIDPNNSEELLFKLGYAMSQFNRGLVLAKKGKMHGAISYYLEAIGSYPEYMEAHSNLGVALASQGNLDDAIAHFLEALRIGPENATTYNNLGNALAGQRKFEEAIAHFSRALKIDPDFIEARYNLKEALRRVGRSDESLEIIARP